jgi:anaphase-promoting complex subunit 6
MNQALSAYRTCIRLFTGCHNANLYLGMEYIRINNIKTAFVTFQEAISLCNKDPLVFNKIGVVFFKQKLYEDAKENFLKGLSLCKEDNSLILQNLTVNLAHTLRNRNNYNFYCRKYHQAILYYEQVLRMDNLNTSILTPLAFSFHLKGEYHKALD